MLIFFNFFDFIFIEFFLFSQFIFKIKQVSMSGDFLIDFFNNFLSLSIFKNHSSHFNVKFVVDFSFHALVHGFHELLYNIFYVLHIFIVIESLLKTFIDAHHLRISTERRISGVSGWFLLFDLLENVHNKAKHSIIFGYHNQSFRINTIHSKHFINFICKVFK